MSDDAELTMQSELTRRTLARAAAGAFTLGLSGLYFPATVDTVGAREGALDGQLGGRRGKNRRGRDKRQRRHRNDRDRGGNDDLRGGPFRNTALTIESPLEANRFLPTYTFYYRNKNGLDSYGPWIADRSESASQPGDTFRYAPGRFRIGVLVTPQSGQGTTQVFVDVRNLAFGFPQGSASSGTGLDPARGKLGSTLISERGYVESDGVPDSERARYDLGNGTKIELVLRRVNDSDQNIEFSIDLDPGGS